MSPAELDREQRLDQVLADYLKAAQQGSAPSRQELLAHHPDLADELASFFADRDRFDRMASPLRFVTPPAPRPTRPRDFGDYEILEEIARGGMGVVYKARQKSLRRLVALKMLLAGPYAAPDELQRFHAEAEAVASLDHPHIVPIHEVGSHEGRPYLCMKLLNGGSLSQRRGAREPEKAVSKDEERTAARTLIAVAEAVHYAHQRGILHRDLKPANILFDEQGQPHVSDFGLAKRQSITAESATLPAPLTHTGAVVGTPGYMAPEQATGRRDTVTVAADVYGLGAVLYELLTGRPPFRGDSALETLRLVLESEPERPSTLTRGLDRDLETICLKCLQKEPEGRYGSAREVADDLRRYLEGRPIQARPVGPLSRVARWARRQPVVAGLSLALTAAVVLGVALVVWLWRTAEHNFQESEKHRIQAEANFQDSEKHRIKAEENYQTSEKHRTEAEASFRQAHQAVKDFCLRLSDELARVPGVRNLRKGLLERGLVYFRDFLERSGGDPRLKAEMAETWMRVGDLARATGRSSEAVSAYRAAQAIYQELHQANPTEIGLQRTVAWLPEYISPLLNRSEDKLASLTEARRLYEQFLEDRPNHPDLLIGLANTFNHLATAHSNRGDVKQSVALCQEACVIQEDLVKRHPKHVNYRTALAATLNNLAAYQPRTPQGSLEALRLLNRMKEIHEGLVKEFPHNSFHKANLAGCCYNLAMTLNDLDRDADMRQVFAESHQMREQAAKDDPEQARYQSELAYSLQFLGKLQQGDGEANKAQTTFERSYKIYYRLHLLEPANHGYRRGVALALYNLGQLHRKQARWAEAVRELSQARDLLLPVVREDCDNLHNRYELGRTLNHLAISLSNMNRRAEALPAVNESLRHLRLAYARAPHTLTFQLALDSALDTLNQLERFLGHPDKAVAATLERKKLWTGNGHELFRVARDLALSASAVGKGNPLTQAERKMKADYLKLVVQVLSEAVDARFRDLRRLETDPSLKELRGQTEFEAVVDRVRQARLHGPPEPKE